MLTIRISFEKRGEAAYISLLDLQRVFHRILKRSGLPVYYTQGFNPHIYLSFNCPLSLGQESLCESCDIKTEEEAPDPDFSPKAMLPLALATSIDALAAGVSFAAMQVQILPAVGLIGVTTCLFSAIGVKVGNLFGVRFKALAERAGGAVLVLMGLKILLEGLGVF